MSAGYSSRGGELDDVAERQQAFTRWGLLFAPLAGREILGTTTRDRVYAMAARFRRLGWQRFIAPREPRLQASHSLDYKLSYGNPYYALDPDWVPDPKRWRLVAGMRPRWLWVADGVHLDLQLIEPNPLGGSSMKGPDAINEKSLHFMQMEISTAKRYFGIEPWPRKKAEEQLAALRERIARQDLEQRKSTESWLRESGTPILDSYRDPPLPEIS
jgi:hypothetical protein